MIGMIFKKDELKILWPFYLYYLILGLSMMIMPFLIIYFRNLGFSFFKIAVITSTFGISMFLFEIPTGAFADNLSRKYSVIIGFIISGISVIFIPLVNNFYLLLLLWTLTGLGMTFISGAEEAWVIDNLNHYDRKDLHHEFFIKSQSIASLGAVFAPIIGAILVKIYSISILWYVFGFGFILSAIILWFFGKEMYKPEKSSISATLRKTWSKSRDGLKFSFKQKTIFLLMLGGIFVGLMACGDIGWQPFLVSLSMPVPVLGVLYSVMAALLIITPFLSKLLFKIKVKNVLAASAFIRMILLLSLLLIYPPFYLVASAICILDSVFKTLKDPLAQTYFHKFVPEDVRATVVSVGSMASHITYSVFELGAGVLLDVFGPQKILALGGLFGVFAIATYLKIKD